MAKTKTMVLVLVSVSLFPPVSKEKVVLVSAKIGAKNCTQTFFSQTFRAFPGYPGKIPGYPAKKSLIPWVSRDIPNFLAPTLSRGRPPPHRKISGLKSLGLGSFFVPEKSGFSFWFQFLPKEGVGVFLPPLNMLLHCHFGMQRGGSWSLERQKANGTNGRASLSSPLTGMDAHSVTALL